MTDNSDNYVEKQKNTSKEKKEENKITYEHASRIKSIAKKYISELFFQQDSTFYKYETPIKAFFNSGANVINYNIRNKNENEINPEYLRLPTLAHEYKHMQTENSQVAYLPMNLSQYNNICIYDEISANITELLYVRQMLIDARASKDKNYEQALREKYSDSFSFYFEALDNGDIKLNSDNSKEFEKEMKFIGRQTQNMWMTYYSQASYLGTFQNWAEYYLQFKDYNELKEVTQKQKNTHSANYQKAKQTLLNIGGLDFSKYIPDLDITNNTYASAQIRINNNMLREDVVHAIGYFNDIPVAPEINPQLSAEQNRQLLLHKYFVENVITRYCKHMDMNNPYDKKFFTKNISFRIDDFEEVLRYSPDRWQEWQEKTTAIATNSKIEKNSSKKGNDALFQKELAKIYTFQGVNILDYSKNKNNPAKLLPNHNYDMPTNNEYTPTSKLTPKEKESNSENPYDLPMPMGNVQSFDYWSKTNHISNPMKVKFYDFSKPILRDRLDEIIKKEKEGKTTEISNQNKKTVLSIALQHDQPTNFNEITYPNQKKLEKFLKTKQPQFNIWNKHPTHHS